MSKRVSAELNKAVKDKSCFNCTWFKIKPFKFNELNKQTAIDFQLVTNTGKCVKELFNKHNGVRSSVVSKRNTPVILRDALKSIGRYKTIAENCGNYDGEEVQIKPKQPIQGKRANYKLIKYLF